MSATTTSPAWKRPGATWSPTLLAWNVTVSDALTAAPTTSPVDASTPEGRSTETTGRPQALIRSIIAAASGARSTVEAGAEERVDHHVAPFDRVGLDSLAARLAEHASGDAPVATVRATAADDGEASRVGIHAHRLVRDGGAGPLHQVDRGRWESGERLLGGPHLGRSAERLVPRADHGISSRAARRRLRPPSCGSGSARHRSRACRPARHIPRCVR